MKSEKTFHPKTKSIVVCEEFKNILVEKRVFLSNFSHALKRKKKIKNKGIQKLEMRKLMNIENVKYLNQVKCFIG
jgi:hypothetical protein